MSDESKVIAWVNTLIDKECLLDALPLRPPPAVADVGDCEAIEVWNAEYEAQRAAFGEIMERLVKPAVNLLLGMQDVPQRVVDCGDMVVIRITLERQ